MAELTFIPKAIDLVKLAVAADNEEDYERALSLYKQSLEYFMTGLKYEKNDTSKKSIRDRMKEYMNRAEQISEILEQSKQQAAAATSKSNTKKSSKSKSNNSSSSSSSSSSNNGNHGGAANNQNNDDNEDSEEETDPETEKMQKALAHCIVSNSNVKWSDVAGLEGAKTTIRDAVILPTKFPQLFTGKRTPWRGILLYGPPGTGKSHIARAVSSEVQGATFFSVSSSDLVSKYQGESERLVANLFALARKKSPAIIFIDEIDSLCMTRSDNENDATRRIKTEFLAQMDGVGKDNTGILVMGATNIPWGLDSAMRRRFEKRIYIPLPDEPARVAMLKICVGNTPNALIDTHYQLIAKRCDGFSGADMSILVREALMEPVRAVAEATHFKRVPNPASSDPNSYFLEPCSSGDSQAQEMSMMDVPSDRLKPLDVTVNDLIKALSRVRPSVNMSELSKFEQWTKEFGQEG